MRKPAFTLVELITMMPFVGAMIVTGSLIVTQGMFVQSEAGIQVQDDATMRDLARRLRADAALADSATLAEGTLRLNIPAAQVSYQIDGHKLTRTHAAVKGTTEVFRWKLQRYDPAFAVEPGGKVAYLTWTVASPRRTGEPRPIIQTVAARMGRGGGQ